MIKLKYGNTNTFFIRGNRSGLLVDTDYAGTMPAFYKALKYNDLSVITFCTLKGRFCTLQGALLIDSGCIVCAYEKERLLRHLEETHN